MLLVPDGGDGSLACDIRSEILAPWRDRDRTGRMLSSSAKVNENRWLESYLQKP
jgi:hypothetical protein